MEKQFVTYEIAKKLKELGFDEPCLAKHDLKHILLRVEECKSQENAQELDYILAPLYQQAFRWFREKHKLHSTITSISQESWQWHITKPGESLGKLYNEDFYTYEEAEQACLDKLIEICKNK